MNSISDSDLMALRETKRRGEIWERHGQSVMLFVVTAVLGFSAKFMWDSSRQVAEMAAEMKFMSLSIARLEGSVSAMRAEYVTRPEFNSYADRLRNIEDMNIKRK